MVSEATKNIMSMIDKAEQKRKNLDDAIKNLRNKRDKDKARLLRDELALANMSNGSGMGQVQQVARVKDEAKEVMDEDHELSDLSRKRADVDRKISEIKHWTGQSEYQDERKQAEAVSYATQIFRSI